MVAARRTSIPGMKTIVFSRSQRPADHPEVSIVKDRQQETVAALKAQPGKDIWLFGGGLLFRSLAQDRLVDTVEVGIVPILLGAGVPFASRPRAANQVTAHSSQSPQDRHSILGVHNHLNLRMRPASGQLWVAAPAKSGQAARFFFLSSMSRSMAFFPVRLPRRSSSLRSMLRRKPCGFS